jgi:hypothetical protein
MEFYSANDQFLIYLGAILALVIGVIIIKKVASCLIKTVVGLIVLAILAYVFYTSMM